VKIFSWQIGDLLEKKLSRAARLFPSPRVPRDLGYEVDADEAAIYKLEPWNPHYGETSSSLVPHGRVRPDWNLTRSGSGRGAREAKHIAHLR
jgi:hypothetical protein